MGLSLSNLSDLPGPAKVIVLVASGAAVTGLLRAFNVPQEMLLTLVIGMVALALLIAGFRWLLKKREKTKSVPFLGKLLGTAGGTPQGLADPAKRARLDDLRKKFQEGVEKFKSAGKDIYALPWYLIVGPSGSGKTEAIRHCNVGFPPGLQDYLQGAGGTLNMHWWFTNHAVIVDTAGKMFMEEAKAGESSEWKEFLKLLKDSRPLTPINGMLLCIGVDSLIRDSAEEISEKAAKIARQLDVIQRTLDVRFPVFIVVTKCDLITGFREYFENVTDPALQSQMLGWSNPSGLDEAFNPELVDQHVELVRQRLLRRRLALIIDPVHTDDPQARRTDQVDALFALPESLSRLSSRLQRYLQLIFMAGEWSPKPLFLRGIYFTSSMRQGAELDEELAKIMGVPVENLPGGGVSEEKSYFLRDVFMAKVFREKGLVTRATNVKQQQRGRKLAMIGTGIGTVAVLLLVTILSLMNFNKTVRKPTDQWQAVHTEMDGLELVRDDKGGTAAYLGGADITLDGESMSRVEVLDSTRDLASRPPSAPLVVAPFAKVSDLFSGDPADRVREAHAALVERTALAPLVRRARTKMTALRATEWDDNATGVLAGLLSIERGEAPPVPKPVEKKRNQPDEPAALKVEWPIDSGRFLAFILPEGGAAAKGESAKLQQVVTWTYGSDGGKAPWPPVKTLEKDQIAVEKGVKAFNDYWLGAAVQVRLGELDALRNEFKEFVDAEDALAATVREYRAKNAPTRAAYDQFRQKWDGQFAALKTASDKVELRLKRPDFDVKKLDADIKSAEESLRAQADESYRVVMGEAPPSALLDALKGAAGEKGKGVEKAGDKLGFDLDAPKPWKGDLEDLRKALVDSREKVKGKDGIGAAVASLRDYFTTGDGGKLLQRNSLVYAATARFQAYERANAALVLAVGKPVWGELASGCKQAEDAIAGLNGEVRTRLVAFAEPSQPKLSVKDGEFDFLMGSATRDARARVVRSVVESGAPGDSSWVKAAVARLASEPARTAGSGSIGGKYLSPIVVPLTVAGDKGISIDPAYQPDAAKALFGDLKYLSGLYSTGAGAGAGAEGPQIIEDPGMPERARTSAALIAVYGVEYFQHWTAGILGRLEVVPAASWSNFRENLGLLNGQEEATSGHLRRLCELMTDALSVQGLVVAEGKVKKESVDQWIGKIQGDLGPTLDIGKRLREDRFNWFGLGQNGTDAQAKLGSLRADQFQSDYLQGFSCDTVADGAVIGPATRYVNLLRMRALRTLGDELEGARQDILRRLDQYRRLPMRMAVNPDRGAADALTPEQVKEFRAKMPLGQRAVAGGESQIGQGGQTSHSCVNEQLDRIYGRKGFGAQEVLFGSLNAWLPWVLGERGDVSFELQVMPDTGDGLGKEARTLKQQGILNAQGVFRQTEATFGSAFQRRADEEAELSPSLIKDVPLPIRNNQRLKLTFSDVAGGGGRQGTREVSSLWSVLELLAEPDAEPYSPPGSASAADRPAAMWRVPVVFSPVRDGQPEKGADGKPQKFYKWVLVKFSSEVPAKAAWPTQDKWQ